jgi:hypothetical protein
MRDIDWGDVTIAVIMCITMTVCVFRVCSCAESDRWVPSKTSKEPAK